MDRDKWPREMASAGEAAYETALSTALTQTDRPTRQSYHSDLFHSCTLFSKITFKTISGLFKFKKVPLLLVGILQACLLFNMKCYILVVPEIEFKEFKLKVFFLCVSCLLLLVSYTITMIFLLSLK